MKLPMVCKQHYSAAVDQHLNFFVAFITMLKKSILFVLVLLSVGISVQALAATDCTSIANYLATNSYAQFATAQYGNNVYQCQKKPSSGTPCKGVTPGTNATIWTLIDSCIVPASSTPASSTPASSTPPPSSSSAMSSLAGALDLVQKPLFLTAGAEPNVMFVLDDSGSMQFEVMPEELIQQSGYYVYPRAAGIYGGSDYNDRVAKPNNIAGMVVRSSNNTLYYDPSVTYTPWPKPDGTGSLPVAVTTCALHNPYFIGTGEGYCRDLTVYNYRKFNAVDSTWVTCTSGTSCTTDTTDFTYWPATYWRYTGTNTAADIWNASLYTKVEIRTGASYSGDGRVDRTDCTAGTCTYAQEILNFANWYTYYRSRILTARAGAGKAFSEQGEGMRVGFGSINHGTTTIDGVATKVVISGVRSFDAAGKNNFLTTFYTHPMPAAGTPLRTALDTVGQYFMRADDAGPWSNDPSTGDSTKTIESHAECRASSAILMTDGYWNDSFSAIGNSDNTAGSAITNNEPGATPASYTYAAGMPYQDAYSDTLADVAMKYWKTDLQPSLANRIKVKTTPVSDPLHANDSVDTAFWQHMSTFTVGLGVDGTLVSPPTVKNAIKQAITIAWPDPTPSAADQQKIDDLYHAAVNGHGDFFSAKNPDQFSTRLSNVLGDIARRPVNNASAAAANSTSLNENSTVYQALFSSEDWSGELKAFAIDTNGVLSTTPIWQASIPATRNIWTMNGTAGVAFAWGNLSTAQQSALRGTSGDVSIAAGQARLAWFNGNNTIGAGNPYDLRDRSYEIPATPTAAATTGVRLLGDIVNSDPVYAGVNNSHFEHLSAALGGGATYTTWYNANKKSRREVLYVGANDGMLHGFNAHIPTGSDPFPAKVLGVETFAYIPTAVFTKLRAISSASYGLKTGSFPHTYTVNGPMYISDAYFKDKSALTATWHNILVGTLGAGGRGLYALDITNPELVKVLFEFTGIDFPEETPGTDYAELGNILGAPVIAPGQDGRWKIFVGNGYNSRKNGVSNPYLGIIDIEDAVANTAPATSQTKFIATHTLGVDGLAQPALLPDTNGVVRAAYAGDLHGNLWKFDFPTGTASSLWGLAFSGAPLYIAEKTGTLQQITASPTLGLNRILSPVATMVYFGTGRYMLTGDDIVGSQIQTFYAIADKGVAISSTDRSTLHQKTLTASGTQRTITGQTTGTTGNLTNAVPWATVNGWYLDFTPGERITTKPLLLFDRLLFPTVIPSTDPCNAGGTGWLMELIGVGDGNLDYTLLNTTANTFMDVGVFGKLTAIQGTGRVSGSAGSAGSAASAATSSAPSYGCDGAGNIAVMATHTNGKLDSNQGKKTCDMFNRQSWRELH